MPAHLLESTDFDVSVPVLIVKLGRYVIHHGAVGVARSLGRLGVPVYAIVEDCCTPLAVSRYLRGSFTWRRTERTPESILSDLLDIAGQLPRRPVLLPTDDVAAIFIAEHQAELADSCLVPKLDSALPRRLCNKKELHSISRAIGVPCPETTLPGSMDDVYAFIEKAVFPVVVKGIEPHRLPAGVPSAAIAYTPRELIALFKLAGNQAATNLMFQEYIPEGSENWVFHGYRNPETGCLVAFTGRKLRSWPREAGVTSLGVSVRNEELTRMTTGLLDSLGFAGIMDLDYRLDKRDGQYKLLDFNPRLGGNFQMFRDRTHLDVARAQHLDLTGRKVRQTETEEGRLLLVESYDLFACVGDMWKGTLTPKGWWESLKGKKELAWLSWDDPFPFFMMWIRLLVRIVARVFRRARLMLPGSGIVAETSRSVSKTRRGST
jgi:D-aspartate ligase